MLDALTALDLPYGPLVVPTIGLDPVAMITFGRVAAPVDTASFGLRRPDHIHVASDEAIEYNVVVTRSVEVAACRRSRNSPVVGG